jgi:hypothetical protein
MPQSGTSQPLCGAFLRKNIKERQKHSDIFSNGESKPAIFGGTKWLL